MFQGHPDVAAVLVRERQRQLERQARETRQWRYARRLARARRRT